jgi:formylglycine-generating enzyme required for sulfatase activity
MVVGAVVVYLAWPEPGGGRWTRVTLRVEGDLHVPVTRVPLDEYGSPRWDEKEDVGTTPLENAELDVGEAWLIVGDDDRWVTRWIEGELDRHHEMVVRLVPDEEATEGMVSVPAGEEEFRDLGRRVKWDAFHIDRYEVSRAEFRAFVRESGHAIQSPRFRDDPTGPDLPAAVNWFDALAYAEWHGKRLPLAEEWYAAYFEGGAPTEGNRWKTAAGVNHPLPVRETENDRTGLGVYGMFGNASEWTLTWSLGWRLADGTRAPRTCRLSTGRSFSSPFWDRYGDERQNRPLEPVARLGDLGFRCVRSANR